MCMFIKFSSFYLYIQLQYSTYFFFYLIKCWKFFQYFLDAFRKLTITRDRNILRCIILFYIMIYRNTQWRNRTFYIHLQVFSRFIKVTKCMELVFNVNKNQKEKKIVFKKSITSYKKKATDQIMCFRRLFVR